MIESSSDLNSFSDFRRIILPIPSSFFPHHFSSNHHTHFHTSLLRNVRTVPTRVCLCLCFRADWEGGRKTNRFFLLQRGKKILGRQARTLFGKIIRGVKFWGKRRRKRGWGGGGWIRNGARWWQVKPPPLPPLKRRKRQKQKAPARSSAKLLEGWNPGL